MSGSIERAPFRVSAEAHGASVFTLRNARGMEVRLADWGGTILSVRVPDRRGRFEDVALGFGSAADYLANAPYFGALIGRYANRIAGGRFAIGDRIHVLETNDGPNHLHGGRTGFHRAQWHATPHGNGADVGLTLTHESPEGEGGYPGTLRVCVVCTLTHENELVFDYSGNTDRATPVNLTQHSYFNLAGHGAGSILDHRITIHADAFTPIDATMIPTGELRATTGTPFALRDAAIGEHIDDDDQQLKNAGGYDHNFVLDAAGRGGLRPAARVFEAVSGRVLAVHTTEPGLQLYTGNKLNGEQGKDGVRYGARAGFALETQHFPDSPNQPHFPSTILHPGVTYRSRTVLRFGVA